MTDSPQLDRPWLIAVWPGMGHVALSAGYYLMSKLGMNQFAQLTPGQLFDVDTAIVKEGLIQSPHRPHSRLFAWKAPPGGRDVIVFIGESQPQFGKLAFCERLIDFARDQGVERLFTFAAMATEMQPGSEARVFAAATQQPVLDAMANFDVQILDDGHIGGLNWNQSQTRVKRRRAKIRSWLHSFHQKPNSASNRCSKSPAKIVAERLS
ncbi:PAC2 family protein [Rubripirellula lacrimiformis]|uniref:PAC2 family protein n=1 Tax=Rubripirellula lacrimiformis TaxID=1930273 RepID=A0A517N495_9BACT|nr:PAC2 family protein [Rubripirellula lacrimiformis]QDT01956.1 PAC2 family protein [Rubripirellula lacrimiformis]